MKFLKFILILSIIFQLQYSVFSQEIHFLTHKLRPFSYQENNKIKGFAVEVVKEIMKQTKKKYKISMFPFVRALYFAQNENDYALFIVARRPEREATLKWVGPLITNSVYIYKRKHIGIRVDNLKDLRKVKRIGVGRGNADHYFLKKHGFKNFIEVNTQAQALLMLITNRIDVMPAGELVLPEFAKEAKIDITKIEKTKLKLYDTVLYIGFSLNVSTKIISDWQNALDVIKKSGKYKEIYNKYILEENN